MIRFLNTKLYGKVETIDQIDSTDFADYKEFRAEQRRLKLEYSIAGGHGDMYWSGRCTNEWKS
jgi:hypothetical protein